MSNAAISGLKLGHLTRNTPCAYNPVMDITDTHFATTPDPIHRCAACSAWIEDDTTAKENYKGQWFCAACVNEDESEPAEHRPMSPFAARLFAAFTESR